jgi:predicted RNA methylase
MSRIRTPAVIAGAVILTAAFFQFYLSRDVARDLAPFYPTPMTVVSAMLEMAEVGPSDVVYDLGSGDGRIVAQAAELFGARGVGVEYDPAIARMAEENIRRRKLEHKVEIVVADALKVDISPATVVTVYLLQDTMPLLRPIMDRSLKPGTRIVSHSWYMPGWTPLRTVTVDDGFGTKHTLFLYVIGKQY